MNDNRFNANLTDRAAKQLDELASIYGNKTSAVLAAIDELYQKKFGKPAPATALLKSNEEYN